MNCTVTTRERKEERKIEKKMIILSLGNSPPLEMFCEIQMNSLSK